METSTEWLPAGLLGQNRTVSKRPRMRRKSISTSIVPGSFWRLWGGFLPDRFWAPKLKKRSLRCRSTSTAMRHNGRWSRFF